LDVAGQRRGYLLFTPDGQSSPYSTTANDRELAITATTSVGNYRLKSGGKEGVSFGFSVNYAADQTRLDRLSDKELAAMFGPMKYQLAHTKEQIERNVSAGRIGRELFPPLALMLALVLALEMLVANRFYKE
jgi:hypothetical protein